MSMRPLLRHWSVLIATVAAVAGTVLLARADWLAAREAFETDARIAHRLLSQRVVQHDAVLATLALLPPRTGTEHPEAGLTRVYPRILQVQHRSEGQAWRDDTAPGGAQSADRTHAETQSRRVQRAVLSAVDTAQGRYELVMAAGSGAYAMRIDARQTVPWDEWPIAPDRRPERVTLNLNGRTWTIQSGQPVGRWAMRFSKVLASDSQPFELLIERPWSPADLPWWRMLGWIAVCVAAGWAAHAWQRQTTARRRAEELLRLGQTARLNTLGELAAGMAHELNQPLTAVLASTQAASRLLQDDPPDWPLARQAMDQAAQQARRAADVVGRLRRLVEQPETGSHQTPVDWTQTVRNALQLLEPELRRCHVHVHLGTDAPFNVLADPVALEQIIHNLLMNAMQALERTTPDSRHIAIEFQRLTDQGQLRVSDNGPGIPEQALPHVFEPFFSTREGGLGLGLSLCETLATGMGGSLTAAHNTPCGAIFTLTLPLAPP